VSLLNREQLFITTNGGKKKLESLDKNNVVAITQGESVRVGDFEITAVFADHTVEAFGLIVKAESKTLYFSGDTIYNERLFDIAKYSPDVAFICINGKLGNMSIDEALVIAKKIGAGLNVPNHYDMFASNSADPHLFTERIDGGIIMEFDKEYNLCDVNFVKSKIYGNA